MGNNPVLIKGEKFDVGKLDWTLLPWKSLKQVVAVMDFGARKYTPNAWQHVPDAKRRYLAAAFRHLTDYADGEVHDRESSLPHLAHCCCCLLFLIWFDQK